MKNKLCLISSVVQLVFGILAIISFIILLIKGEDMSKWIITLVFAIVLVMIGIIGIMNDKSNRKRDLNDKKNFRN